MEHGLFGLLAMGAAWHGLAAAEAALPDDASLAEAYLLLWAARTCDYAEAVARTQPQRQKLMLVERKVEEKERALALSLETQRKDAAKSAAKLELPIELFPFQEPYKHFPWEGHFMPRSEAEEALRLQEERLAQLTMKDGEQDAAAIQQLEPLGQTPSLPGEAAGKAKPMARVRLITLYGAQSNAAEFDKWQREAPPCTRIASAQCC